MSSRFGRKARPHKVKPDFKKILGKKHKLEDEEEVERPVEAESTLKRQPISEPQDEESDYDSDEEEYVDYAEDNEEDVQVDFDISVPNLEKDYFGLELYAKNYLNGTPYNYAELTQLVLGDEDKGIPNALTSVIKVPYPEDDKMKDDETKEDDVDSEDDGVLANGGGDEALGWEWNDIYGFVSVLDFNKHKKTECMKQIKDYITENCSDKKVKDQLVEVFNGKPALIVNERVMNLPFEVGAMLHENLHEEITEAVREGEASFFKHYIIITKIFYPVSALDNTKKKKRVEPVFYKTEEEYYYNRAEIKFRFPLKNPYTFDSNSVAIEYAVEHEGVVMIIERNKIEKILKKLASAREQMQKQAQPQQQTEESK